MNPTLWSLITLLGGLLLLLAGGEALVRGAVLAAKRLGISSLVIGLTVVAFGTSTPELVVSLGAAWRDNPAVTFGNVVGSNLANITLLLGLTALVRPVMVERRIVRREIPLMLLTAAAATALAVDGLLGTGAGADLFARGDGLVLMLLFGLYLYSLIGDAGAGELETLPVNAPAAEAEEAEASLWWVTALIAGGLVGLFFGGEWTVGGAVDLARSAGMSETLIALTIVAVGTSLPELVTCISSARRGESDLAIGNLVGSNIYNITFVLGLTAAISPVPVPLEGRPDLLAMVLVSALVLPLAFSGKRISRMEGGGLILAWAGYTVWRVLG